MARLDALDKKTVQKIEKLADSVLRSVKGGKNPFVEIPIRSLANVEFNPRRRLIELRDQKQKRYFFNVGMAKKFMQTFLVSEACKELIDAGKTTSIRDLYYMTKHGLGETKQNTFEEQEESDPIIEDLEVAIDSLREELHLFATGRGSMVGPMTIRDSGDTHRPPPDGLGRLVGAVDRRGARRPVHEERGEVRPPHREGRGLAPLQRGQVLAAREVRDRDGPGPAARGVRRLVQRLHSELKLPVYVLVDNDPWGFYIYSVMKQGSINLAYESMRMAVPTARFVGLSSFDKAKYKLPSNVAIPMNDQDNSRARQMLAYPWFKEARWQREIEEMVRTGEKYELEALSRRGISFITEEYLPKKLRDRDWLE